MIIFNLFIYLGFSISLSETTFFCILFLLFISYFLVSKYVVPKFVNFLVKSKISTDTINKLDFLSCFLLIFIIYLGATGKLVKSVHPIVQGIRNLAAKKEVNLKEKGPLSELAMNINQTSQTLRLQERDLRKRENARANWIAGVSHDIRTPLSMVMGYAGQLEDNSKFKI